jgi:hypothetical protein
VVLLNMSNSANQEKGILLPKWANNLEKEAVKIHEVKHEIDKLEYKER